jgi:hypothetical protein
LRPQLPIASLSTDGSNGGGLKDKARLCDALAQNWPAMINKLTKSSVKNAQAVDLES